MTPGKNTPFTTVAGVANRYKIPASDLVRPAVNAASVNTNSQLVDPAKLRSMVVEQADKITDNQGIMEILLDLPLVRETLVASILSPKDLKEPKLNIAVSPLAPQGLADTIRDHFTKVYPLDSKMADILGDALFDKGSHILMPIPYSMIGRFIKQNTYGQESIKGDFGVRSVGILSTQNNKEFTLESLCSPPDTYSNSPKRLVEITDDWEPLIQTHAGQVKKDIALSELVKAKFGIEEIDSNIISRKLYGNKPYKNSPTAELIPMDAMEDEVTNPLVINPPHESVLVVHVPGEPENHVGYYLFLDDNGYPFKYSTSSNKFKEMSERLDKTMEENATISSLTLGITKGQTGNASKETARDKRKFLIDDYFRRFEKELIAAVSNGMHGNKVELAEPKELYRIMLARQLENMKTKVVYVPACLISYIAFNYDENGTGVSLLEKTKLYASFRAILLFASIMANVKGAVNLSTVSVTLDEKEIDPEAVLDTVMNECMMAQTMGLPLGRLSPVDIVDSLMRAGIQFKVNGGNRLPNTEIDVAETKRDITPPATDLMDMLKTMHYAGLWVTPDTIDRTNSDELATSITSRNLFQARRQQLAQKKYTTMLAGFIRKYIAAGGPLTNELKQQFSEVDKDLGLSWEEFILSIDVILPKADTASINAVKEDFDIFSGFIDQAIESYISEDMFQGILKGDNLASAVAALKKAVANLARRQYISSENMLPELSNLLGSKESKLNELLDSHNDTIIELTGEILRNALKREASDDKKTQKVLDKINPSEEENNDNSDNMDDSNSGESYGDPDDSDSGFDETSGEDSSIDEGGEEGDVDADRVDDTAQRDVDSTDDATEAESTDENVDANTEADAEAPEATDSEVVEPDTTEPVTDDTTAEEEEEPIENDDLDTIPEDEDKSKGEESSTTDVEEEVSKEPTKRNFKKALKRNVND